MIGITKKTPRLNRHPRPWRGRVPVSLRQSLIGTLGRIWTFNLPVNGRMLYLLSYKGVWEIKFSRCMSDKKGSLEFTFSGDPDIILQNCLCLNKSKINIVIAQWCCQCSSNSGDRYPGGISGQKNILNQTPKWRAFWDSLMISVS